MIGNLVLSLLAASFVGAVVVGGDMKADALASAPTQTTSHINGSDVNLYGVSTLNYNNQQFVMNPNFNDGSLAHNIFNLDGSQYSSEILSPDAFILDDTFAFYDYVDGLSLDIFKVHCFRQYITNTSIIYTRFLVSNRLASVGNIEFCLTNEYDNLPSSLCTLFGFDLSNASECYWTLDNSDNINWFGFSKASFNSLNVSSSSSNPSGWSFGEFGFYFTTRNADYIFRFEYMSSYPILDGVNNGVIYSQGYSQGYSDGSANGYAQGYSDAMALASNGDFHSLFNSIADTPLRFLYGLFNFDLFGLSMLVIVLTLLTGIIVFGIVKKFWK